MKKIISLILMCVMLLCVASCKRRPPEDVRADIPAQNSGDAADEPEDKTDKEKSEDKPAENTDDNKNDINTENKKDTETTEQNDKDNVEDANDGSENTEKGEEAETDAPADDSKPTTGPESWVTSTEEKLPPCNVTIDDDFDEGKVWITLTRAQSAARQEYTAADFPGVDIEEVFVGPYYPKTNNRISVTLILTQKDKASVIEAIRILEQSPIVYSASPISTREVIDP